MTEETSPKKLPEEQFAAVCQAAAALLDAAALTDVVAEGGVSGVLAVAIHALWFETLNREGAESMDVPKGIAHGLASALSNLDPPIKLHQARNLMGEIASHTVAGLRAVQLAQSASGAPQ